VIERRARAGLFGWFAMIVMCPGSLLLLRRRLLLSGGRSWFPGAGGFRGTRLGSIGIIALIVR
jgi:hypothetical protein